MELTQEELNDFKSNGFLLLQNFADKAECEAILDVAKAHLKHKIEPIETEIGYGLYMGQTLNIHQIPAIIPLKKGIPHAKKTKNRPSRLSSCY